MHGFSEPVAKSCAKKVPRRMGNEHPCCPGASLLETITLREEAPLGTAAGNHVVTAGHDLARKRHAWVVGNRDKKLRGKVRMGLMGFAPERRRPRARNSYGTAQDQASSFKLSFHSQEHGSETVVPPAPPHPIVV
jgi:hypothetical protein